VGSLQTYCWNETVCTLNYILSPDPYYNTMTNLTVRNDANNFIKVLAITQPLSSNNFIKVLAITQPLSSNNFIQVLAITQPLSSNNFIQVLAITQPLSSNNFIKVLAITQPLSSNNFIQVLAITQPLSSKEAELKNGMKMHLPVTPKNHCPCMLEMMKAGMLPEDIRKSAMVRFRINKLDTVLRLGCLKR